MHLYFLTNVVSSEVIQAFCWMLIHSLWQGLIFTVVAGVAMMLTKKAGAPVRYNIVAGLFFVFIALCLFTFIKELNHPIGHAQALPYSKTVGTNHNSLAYFFKICIYYLSSHASAIVIFWFIIFCFKSVKLATAFVYNNRLKDQKTEPSACWKNKLTDLCQQLNITRTVLLFESEILKIPAIIGHLKPIIFIPVGLLTSLPAGEVEAVLLHELAHIRRNDYVINMIQVIAESIFFFNPALLWMSHVLREERENCCDDVAVVHSGSKKQYIQALISFKEHALYTTPYTTAFPAGKNQLLKRISRIINNRNNTLDRSGRFFFLTNVLLLTLLSIAATNSDINVAAAKRVKEPAAQLTRTASIPSEDTKSIVVGVTDDVVIKAGGASPTKRIKNSIKDLRKLMKQPELVAGNKETVITENQVTFISDAAQTKELANTELTYQQQAAVYLQQAEKDREQAARDRKQADLDRIQAEKDRQQALKDRAQAVLDRVQAEKDRQQAEQDRQRAEKERLDIRQVI